MGAKPKKRHRYRLGRLKVLLVLGVGFYMAVALAGQQSDVVSQRRRHAELEAAQASLQRELDYRVNELDYIGSDDYVENEARSRLGWLKPNETKYMEGNSAARTPASASPAPSSSSSSAEASQSAASASASASPEETSGQSPGPQGSAREGASPSAFASPAGSGSAQP